MRKARIVSARPRSAVQPEPVAAGARWWRRTAVVCCSLGFVSGAVVWHFAGVGSFLSESANAAAASLAPKAAAADRTPIVVVDTNRCTMLTLDRRANNTVAQPCPATNLALRFEPGTGVREDMADFAQLQAVGYRTD